MTSPRHVVVCGAGVIGASVAWNLARHGTQVTVVERTGVACAASGKSGGFLALDWCDDSPLGPLARLSFRLHAELPGELGAEYGYRRMDTFMMRARENATLHGGHGIAAPAWLDGAGVVRAVLGSTETTAQVEPAQFTTALVDGARKHGAVVRTGVVSGVVQRDGRAAGVAVDGDTIEADAVVLAMGPWTSRAAGVPLPHVYGLKGYSVVLDAAGVPPHALFVDYRTAAGQVLEPEIMPRPDGTVYVCGMADPADLPESADEVTVDPSCRGNVTTMSTTMKMVARITKIGNVRSVRWCFSMGLSPP